MHVCSPVEAEAGWKGKRRKKEKPIVPPAQPSAPATRSGESYCLFVRPAATTTGRRAWSSDEIGMPRSLVWTFSFLGARRLVKTSFVFGFRSFVLSIISISLMRVHGFVHALVV